MSDFNALDELLSEAELVVHKYNVKMKSSGNSYGQSKLSNDATSNHFNESSFLDSHSLLGKPSHANTTSHSTEDVNAYVFNFSDVRKSNGSCSHSATKEASSNLQQGKRLENGYDEDSTFHRAATENGDVSGDESEYQENTEATVAELRQLCWVLLSSANTALRDYSRLAKHMESTAGSKSLGLASGLDVEAAQDRVSQAAAKIQHFLVEVGVTQRRAQEAEEECLRLCTLLNSLLQATECVLPAAGLQHLAGGAALISPRRSSAQRLVETACSNLELVRDEFHRSQELQQQQAERVEQLQRHIIEGEKKLLEATNKCSSLVLENREQQRQQELQLQQLYLQLARAEEGLQQTQSELSATVTSRKEFEAEQLRVSAALREELAQCQQKLLSSTAVTKDIKAQFDHLRDESTSQLLEVGAECDRLQHELDTLVASNECNEKSSRAAMAAAREERDAAESAAALLQGDLQALQLSHSKLQTLADERLSIVEDVTKELLAAREELSDCKAVNDAEVKNLHDKLSKQGCSLCECQQQLRKEQMLNLQQKTQLQLEIQRVTELKQHNKALLKQNEDLNKVLADQLDRKVADDVKNILKSLNRNDDFQSAHGKNYDWRSTSGKNFNESCENESSFLSPTVKTNSFTEREFETIPEIESRYSRFCSRVQFSSAPDSDRNLLSSRQKVGIGNLTTSLLPGDIRRLPAAGHNSPNYPSDVIHHLADLRCIEESMAAFASKGAESKAPLKKLDDDKDEDVTQPLGLTCLSSSSSLTRRFESLRVSSVSPKKENRLNDSKYGFSRESFSTRPKPLVTHKSGQLSSRFSTSHDNLLTARNSDFQTSTGADSGLGSSGNERDEAGAELRRVRAEARKERLEAAKLREKCALLQVEVDSQKTALEDERMKHRFKSRLNRVKREEFGQFLGELEENFDRYRVPSSSTVQNCSSDDVMNTTADFTHSASLLKRTDVPKTSSAATGSGLATTACGRSFDLTDADVSLNGVRLGACRTDNGGTVESTLAPSDLNDQTLDDCHDTDVNDKY